LAILLSGSALPTGWSQADRTCDLYDLKAILSALLGGREIKFAPKERAGFVLGCEIKIDDQTLGIFARLTPARERELDFTTPVYVAELDLGKLRKLITGTSHIEELPQFPGSSRDAAMELPATTANAQIEAVITKLAEPRLTASACFDVFTDPTGEKLDTDKKSIAYRFHYRATDGNRTAAEFDAAHQRVLEALTKSLEVKFR